MFISLTCAAVFFVSNNVDRGSQVSTVECQYFIVIIIFFVDSKSVDSFLLMKTLSNFNLWLIYTLMPSIHLIVGYALEPFYIEEFIAVTTYISCMQFLCRSPGWRRYKQNERFKYNHEQTEWTSLIKLL
jgi:hypothetical protein